jgi:hypothetical protein
LISLKENDRLEDVGIDGRIILNYILNVGWKGRTGSVRQIFPCVIMCHLRNPGDFDFLAQGRKRFWARYEMVLECWFP